MRKWGIGTALPVGLLCGVLFIYIVCLSLQAPNLPKLWVYPLARDIVKTVHLYKFACLQEQESAHFIIKYHQGQEELAAMTITAAERAYGPVTYSLGYMPLQKSVIIIMSDRQEMQKNFGWSAEQSAVGVFWAGMIQILSPLAWIASDNPRVLEQEFIKNGPVTHEFTHLVVDGAARCNYPRWFTEGIAQYQEYKLNGYEWITPDNSLQQNLYTLAELERGFDELSNQSLAYRQSFAAVRYIYEVYGDTRVRALLQELNHGKTMSRAVQTVLQMEYAEYEQAWRQWALAHMDRP